MHYLLLFVAGLATGFVSTIAGGGSFISLSTLILVGLPPAVANGTNRIGSFFQSVSGTAGFKSKGISTFPYSLWLGLAAIPGAVLGALLAVNIRGEMFKHILAILMILFFIAIILDPIKQTGADTERMSKKHRLIGLITFFFVGIYGGFIESGVGIIIILALRYINRLSLVKTNSAKVLIVSIYTLAALAVFIWNNEIDWAYGFVVAAGTGIGGWLTSRWSTNLNEKVVRYIISVIILALAVRLWFF
jgi:uncharacterized membrane protein YfcA